MVTSPGSQNLILDDFHYFWVKRIQILIFGILDVGQLGTNKKYRMQNLEINEKSLNFWGVAGGNMERET